MKTRLYCGCLLAVAACGAGMPTAEEQARVGAYGVELGACVEHAKTLEESQACRAKVSARYGRDGGL